MGLESKAPATPRGDHSGAKLKWPDEPHPSDKEGDTDDEETGDDESESEDPGVKAKIKQLWLELKKAEDDAAAGKKRRSDAKRKRKQKKAALTRPTGSAKDVKKKKHRAEEASTRLDKRERGKTPTRTRRKRSPVTSESEGERKPKAMKKKGRNDDDPVESGDGDSSEEDELFKPKKVADQKGKTGDEDRGPFGSGEPVKFPDDDEDTSDSESGFRKGLAVSVKSSQQRLLAYTNKYPGGLACRLLLKMQTATARDTVGPSSSRTSRTPPVALHHILTVLLPNLGGKSRTTVSSRVEDSWKHLGPASRRVTFESGRHSLSADGRGEGLARREGIGEPPNSWSSCPRKIRCCWAATRRCSSRKSISWIRN